jgi:hypothetical protein
MNMPVTLRSNHDDSAGGMPLDPDVLIQLIKGKAIKDGDYNDDGGNVNWFQIEFVDGTWITIHDLHPGAGCIYTMPRR